MNTPCSVCCSQSVSHPYSRWSISKQCSTMEVQEHKYTQTFKKCSHFFSFNEYQMLKSRIDGMRFNVENVSDNDFRDRDNIRLQREHATYRTYMASPIQCSSKCSCPALSLEHSLYLFL